MGILKKTFQFLRSLVISCVRFSDLCVCVCLFVFVCSFSEMFCALINRASSYVVGADAILDTELGYSDSFHVFLPISA